MERMSRVLSAAGVLMIAGALSPSSGLAQQTVPARAPEFRTVSAVLNGAIKGVVSDDVGGPLAGAMVSVLGTTVAMTVTDSNGRFALEKLPAGEDTLRAHLAGFAASRRENVLVSGTSASAYRLQLRRLDAPVAPTANANSLASRPIISAGFALPDGRAAEPADDAGDD